MNKYKYINSGFNTATRKIRLSGSYLRFPFFHTRECGALFDANVPDADGECECERRFSLREGVGWATFFALLFLHGQCVVLCMLGVWRMQVKIASVRD